MFPKETTFYGQLYLQDFIYLLVFQAGLSVFAVGKANTVSTKLFLMTLASF